MSDHRLDIPEGLVGLRLDAGMSKLSGISRSRVAAMCEAGLVSINGKPVDKSYRLQHGDSISYQFTEESDNLEIIADEVSELEVIFQDEHIVVINKPAGVVSHPSVGFQGPSVPGVLLSRGIQLTTSGASERQGIVQRLDVGTSGLMMLAKTELSYSVLKQMFRDRVVKKTYHAVVQGQLDPPSGTLDAPIARSQKHDYKFTVAEGGKPAITHYDSLELFVGASLLEIGLETGRTHQIRVHMSVYKHPLVGDTLYGPNPSISQILGLQRQWLHARVLEFAHPVSGERMRFEAEYPQDLANSLAKLRSGVNIFSR